MNPLHLLRLKRAYDRKKILAAYVSKETNGLEIGPSYRPIVRKDEGYRVEIMDHLDTQGLREKYHGHEYVDEREIEEVDYVWSGEDYLSLIGREHHYDWIIASHVIEHTPDLIDFLLQCDSILSPGGRLVLAIPDKRFCFDVYRQLTGLGQVIDRHLSPTHRHTAGEVAEEHLHCINLDGLIAWNKHTRGNPHIFHPTQLAIDKMNEVIENDTFMDVHSWCFIPSSFQLLVLDLKELGFTPFVVEEIHEAPDGEFHCVLTKDVRKSLPSTRLELLRAIPRELRAIRW